MSAVTSIEWTDRTWNPVTGCSKVSSGCTNCYAEAISLRFKRSVGPWNAVNAPQNVILHPDRLMDPLRWKEPQRVFVNSMSDLFHEQIPDDFLVKVFTVMGQAIRWAQPERHTYQILTKRPERMAPFMERLRWRFGGPWRMDETGDVPLNPIAVLDGDGDPTPASHIWLGTSVEDQRAADERIPHLLRTPAAVRFLSCEPLLGPVNLRDLLVWDEGRQEQVCIDALTAEWAPAGDPPYTTTIDWVIAGGESGPRHRPIDPDWARSLRDQCQAAGVAFFFKQWSGRTPKADGRLLDGRLWDEFPTPRVAVPT